LDFRVLVNDLAQQFKVDFVAADAPWAERKAREEKAHARLSIDWELLRETFAE
jgi:hypothetical protein